MPFILYLIFIKATGQAGLQVEGFHQTDTKKLRDRRQLQIETEHDPALVDVP